jgi:hypothetical protein
MDSSYLYQLALAHQALTELRRFLRLAMSDDIQARAAAENASITSRALIAEADRLLAQR